MKNLVLLILIACVSIFIYKTYLNQNGELTASLIIGRSSDTPAQTVIDSTQKTAIPPVEIQHPVPQLQARLMNPKQTDENPDRPDLEITETTTEQLNTSDESLFKSLSQALGTKLIKQLFKSKDIIRNAVVFVDNLSRNNMSLKNTPLRRTEGTFKIQKMGSSLFLAPENSERYHSHIKLVSLINTNIINTMYIEKYALFQKAYEELGYPDNYFNDRVIEVIDHLLTTPEMTQPVKLNRPKVFYTYYSKEIETLSAGQKMLLRTSPDQQRIIKGKLKEIRSALATTDT